MYFRGQATRDYLIMTTEWQAEMEDKCGKRCFSSDGDSIGTSISNSGIEAEAEEASKVAALGLISLATSTPSKKRKCISSDDSSTDNHSNGFTRQVRKKESHGEKKLCWLEGCTSFATGGGVCYQHRHKRKRCRHEGCTNQARQGRLCCRHGAKMTRCSHEGCTNQVVKNGVCLTHGAKVKTCMHEGCSKAAQRGGVCYRHGAKAKTCRYEGCTTMQGKEVCASVTGPRDAVMKDAPTKP